ncbi:valine--tRNA ligase [Clostridium sp. 'deep sea']|uniref:valine--tRNA ligase n=1 Tax=Clostridium sp. 'deep sea' TaxID=2779445 RepID=UPI00189657F6|nr:valine--tRNA ligase [Clostridium sp. 'deep sea']QOR35435.1 valine--tRNA ligase [Clostridium sp. 'deep sea']
MLEKKYKPMITEVALREFWENEDVYKFNINENNKEIYSIDTPPPTVSGKLHIGHIFSYTQAEMIARYKRMRGFNVFYPFGFDDNGLPTERLVENEHKVKASELKRSEFTKLCLNTVDYYENEFKELWQSLGFSCDWNLLYRTISPECQRISQKSFIDLYHKNKAYIEESPVLYCTNCQTSIAQAELETQELSSSFNHVKFMVESKAISIATTRPELLNSCLAILINPSDNKHSYLIGKKALVPLYGFEVPIIADEDVDINKGSGMVMFCTFGDTQDLEWFKKYDFSYKKTITKKGFIADNVAFIGGLHVKKARKKIIELLEEHGLLIKTEKIKHNVSVHERCSHEIEIIPSEQWYIDIMSSKDEFIKIADKINWNPSYMKARYLSWVNNLKWNWCISRQRYFGVPFPVWYCKNCGKVKIAKNEELPVNPQETNPSEACECGSTSFIPETAVLDTWATSSVTPLINAKWGEKNSIVNKLLPMSMRTQAHEIIRTWAFYTIVKSYYHFGVIPWKDVMICGFVLARKGEKIGKSKNNSSYKPKTLIATHSADSVRYWAASAKLGTDTTFSEQDLKLSKRFITKLWNAAKFSLMHLGDFEVGKDVRLLKQDQWILDKLNKTLNTAAGYLDNYEIGLARNTLDEFFWKDYCDNYLELVKDRLYKPQLYGAENRESAQQAVYLTLLAILKSYAIFTPFITEKIYKSYFEQYEQCKSIHLLQWNFSNNENNQSLLFGECLKEVLTAVRKFKSENVLSMKDKIDCLTITIPSEIKALFREVLPDLYSTTHAQQIYLNEGTRLIIGIK